MQNCIAELLSFQGNTCYLNAILQCIVHTPFLHERGSLLASKTFTRFLTELNEEWLQKQDQAESSADEDFFIIILIILILIVIIVI